MYSYWKHSPAQHNAYTAAPKRCVITHHLQSTPFEESNGVGLYIYIQHLHHSRRIYTTYTIRGVYTPPTPFEASIHHLCHSRRLYITYTIRGVYTSSTPFEAEDGREFVTDILAYRSYAMWLIYWHTVHMRCDWYTGIPLICNVTHILAYRSYALWSATHKTHCHSYTLWQLWFKNHLYILFTNHW